MRALLGCLLLLLVSPATVPQTTAQDSRETKDGASESVPLRCEELGFRHELNWLDDAYAHSIGKDVIVRFVPRAESTTITVATRPSIAPSGFAVTFVLPHPAGDKPSVRASCKWRRDTSGGDNVDDRIEILDGNVFITNQRESEGVPKYWKFCLNLKLRGERRVLMGGFAIE